MTTRRKWERSRSHAVCSNGYKKLATINERERQYYYKVWVALYMRHLSLPVFRHGMTCRRHVIGVHVGIGSDSNIESDLIWRQNNYKSTPFKPLSFLLEMSCWKTVFWLKKRWKRPLPRFFCWDQNLYWSENTMHLIRHTKCEIYLGKFSS